jgi:hypothetical protein
MDRANILAVIFRGRFQLIHLGKSSGAERSSPDILQSFWASSADHRAGYETVSSLADQGVQLFPCCFLHSLNLLTGNTIKKSQALLLSPQS